MTEISTIQVHVSEAEFADIEALKRTSVVISDDCNPAVGGHITFMKIRHEGLTLNYLPGELTCVITHMYALDAFRQICSFTVGVPIVPAKVRDQEKLKPAAWWFACRDKLGEKSFNRHYLMTPFEPDALYCSRLACNYKATTTIRTYPFCDKHAEETEHMFGNLGRQSSPPHPHVCRRWSAFSGNCSDCGKHRGSATSPRITIKLRCVSCGTIANTRAHSIGTCQSCGTALPPYL